MIKIENTRVVGWEDAVRGMRNPMNSWDKSDTQWTEDPYYEEEIVVDREWNDWFLSIGRNDKDLMLNLAKAGPVHAKYRRMIVVYCDITAPLYWWKEFDTYKVGTVANSCSTMHKIHDKEFELDDFSHEHLNEQSLDLLKLIITHLNTNRKYFLAKRYRKDYWWQMIQLLPSSYNQRRTIMLNYEVLHNIYNNRKEHKLDEWRYLCNDWIKSLPFSEIITLERSVTNV